MFKGVHDTPTYINILFKKPLRLCVAISLYSGAPLTAVFTTLALDSGHARASWPAVFWLPAAAAGAAALIPRGGPPCASGSAQPVARPASRRSQQRQQPPAGAAGHRHRQSEFYRPRRLCPLSDQWPALLSAIHQTPRRRGQHTPDPGPRNTCRHMDFRAVCPPTQRQLLRAMLTVTTTNPPGSTPAGRWRPSSPNKIPAPASTGSLFPSTPAGPGTAPPARPRKSGTG